MAPQDQLYASTYISAASCPRDGKDAALILPHCNTEEMSLHLAEIATMVSPARHAVLLRDQGGWHHSAVLTVPPNTILLPLPPKCPELNVMKNVSQFMRDSWLSDLIFAGYDDIVANCCEA